MGETKSQPLPMVVVLDRQAPMQRRCGLVAGAEPRQAFVKCRRGDNVVLLGAAHPGAVSATRRGKVDEMVVAANVEILGGRDANPDPGVISARW